VEAYEGGGGEVECGSSGKDEEKEEEYLVRAKQSIWRNDDTCIPHREIGTKE
jgi:hypothetical protein